MGRPRINRGAVRLTPDDIAQLFTPEDWRKLHGRQKRKQANREPWTREQMNAADWTPEQLEQAQKSFGGRPPIEDSVGVVL